MQSCKVRVLSNVKVSNRYWHLRINFSGTNQTIDPGQFFHLLCGEDGFPFLRRPLSIYRIDSDKHIIEFLYLVKGVGTKRLTELKEGENINVFGPLGRGFTLRENDQHLLLLARGVGIATLAALAFKAINSQKKVTAILSARSENDLLAANLLSNIGVEVYKVTDENGTSEVSHVEQLISSLINQRKIDALYTCGSKRLVKLMKEISKREELPGEVALEEHMGCAMGVCFACVTNIKDGVETKNARVCIEGPVFPLEQVML